ncbi:endo-1,4-beta-glucanase [Synechococcus sp. WH 7805]|uniref:glycoside hydrolase family 9 protein n=1 Tax=unclassified Synechococcus TaxID=2626047 RepID=UPI00006B6887|nr:glycoside hydrolase family 9 protein [Synechococcus sp. WH 7805]EAR17369.1 endo-1,4-beta-glucanase [Synechococcus sp. WH 7805]
MTPSNTLQVTVNGELWWGGFTAELTVSNPSDQALDNWSISFISSHDLDPEAWGVEISRELLDDGQSRYILSGSSWGQSIPAGGDVRIGFNGRQGFDLGREGALTEAMLMTELASNSVIPQEAADMSVPHDHSGVTGLHTDITTWGSFHGSNHNSEHNELVGGRTAITTEAMVAYNGLRAFAGLEAVELEVVGAWAFAQGLTNNTQPWGDDLRGVGLWYAMQGAKVGWIADEAYNPQILADIQHSARQGDADAVMTMVETFGHEGFASYLRSHALEGTFINTLKMEPHYGGWMHGRAHGFLNIEGVAINHDINHLTVLDWEQTKPFMNDTFNYPQWPALEVSDDTVINYFQSMVTLGNPLEGNLNQLQTTLTSDTDEDQWNEFNRIEPKTTKTGRSRFIGTAQPDALISTAQKDIMTGRGGADLFAFIRTGGPIDVVTDFNRLDEDKIGIDAESFPGIDTIDLATANNKTEYQQLKQSDANIIYQAYTGKLVYNENGSRKGLGSNDAAIAKFKGNPLINSDDIVLIKASSTPSSPQDETETDPQTPPITTTDTPNTNTYAEALKLSLLFYEANRSGDLDEATNRVPWRGDSGLNDGNDGIYFGDATAENLQPDINLDLTGGYHDAGDHVKFGLPLASTLSTLTWGGLAFADGYEITGQADELLSTVKWGTDYLLKAHQVDANGSTDLFIVQVGDGQADHALWSSPESQSIARPALAITAEKPGSDVAAASAAALASASILFRDHGEVDYANELLNNAEALFDFAVTYQGKYSDSIASVQPFYNSWSGFQDELAYGGLWLARGLEAAGQDGSTYRLEAQDRYHTMIGGLNHAWAPNWDDASYGTAVLLSQDLEDQQAMDDVSAWLDSWVTGDQGPQITDGGLRFVDQWGSLRYAANTAMLAGIVADSITNPGGAYSELAVDSIDYILGDNPRGFSYLVGFGDNFPQQPHHRAASGVGWEGFNAPNANEYVLAGALVGGPSSADDFAYNDLRSDYISNEVAIDYNAGLTGALAFAAQTTSGFG